jgi:protein-S-isoprenylcysteine O-methyltransferase Ste14
VVAVVVGLAAPALQSFGVLSPVVDGWFTRWVGALVAVVGIVMTMWAQGVMGDSWRVAWTRRRPRGWSRVGRSP